MRFLIVTILFFVAPVAFAQEVHEELQETVPATVLQILDTDTRDIIGTDTTATIQTVEAHIDSGLRSGDRITFENDILLLEEGDAIFLNRLIAIDGTEYYLFKDVDRRSSLVFLGILFVGALVFFAGMQGVRALISLAGSVGVIIFILVPLLLSGYPPVITSIVIAGLILAVAIFVTHGIRAQSVIAFVGTVCAVVLTGIVAQIWVFDARLTGFGSDASVYLNFSTQGSLDFAGLLLGSIMIGILGVLDDVAITQASVVRELKATNAALSAYQLYKKALRVGRDHVGSLVNTLALAYIGVSLPLVLLLARTDSPVDMILNQEIVAAELIRILIGSIGLILAVPITTALASWWFGKKEHVTHDHAAHHH